MLLIALALLGLVWLAVVVVVISVCASAAAGDRALTRSDGRGSTKDEQRKSPLLIA